MTAQPNEIMRAWQKLLVEAGYPMVPYGADGLGGQTTVNAIRAYQKDHRLPITGQFDDATRDALNPKPVHQISSIEVAILTAALSVFLPPQLKELAVFPTIVQFIISILPGVPDDIKLVENEIAELASTDSGVKKLRTALVFAEALIDRIKAILDKVDPAGAIQPPASQVALTKPTA